MAVGTVRHKRREVGGDTITYNSIKTRRDSSNWGERGECEGRRKTKAKETKPSHKKRSTSQQQNKHGPPNPLNQDIMTGNIIISNQCGINGGWWCVSESVPPSIQYD